MIIKKKFLSVLVLACMILLLLPVISPMQASAFGSRDIDELKLYFSMPPVNAADVSALNVTTSTAGCYIESYAWYDIYGQPITNKFTGDSATIEIVVVPSSGYYFSGAVVVTIDGEPAPRENYGSELHISKSFSPVIWAPSMVKHPSDETVIEGGVASFVSYSSCTDKSSWQILDPDGAVYSSDAFAEKYPDLFVDVSFDKMNISPVTKELDGFKVRCCFSGPGGDVNSNYALITVEDEPIITPTPSEIVQTTPVPTPAHDHVFSDEYSCDVGYHWYACPCGERLSSEEHSFDWTQLTSATLSSSGSVRGVCTVCGYVLKLATELDPAVAEQYREQQAAVSEAPATEDIYIEEEHGLFENRAFLYAGILIVGAAAACFVLFLLRKKAE